MGLTATEQCHFPASKQEGSIVHSSQRECSAISLDYLGPEHFANKLQLAQSFHNAVSAMRPCWTTSAQIFQNPSSEPFSHHSWPTSAQALVRQGLGLFFLFCLALWSLQGFSCPKYFLFLLHPAIFPEVGFFFSCFEPSSLLLILSFCFLCSHSHTWAQTCWDTDFCFDIMVCFLFKSLLWVNASTPKMIKALFWDYSIELQCPIEVAQKAIKFVVLSCFALVKGTFFPLFCAKLAKLQVFMYNVFLQLQEGIAMH